MSFTGKTITIPIKKSNSMERGQKENCWDPTKNSPPNSWNNRLNNRIHSYCNVLHLNNEEKRYNA